MIYTIIKTEVDKWFVHKSMAALDLYSTSFLLDPITMNFFMTKSDRLKFAV